MIRIVTAVALLAALPLSLGTTAADARPLKLVAGAEPSSIGSQNAHCAGAACSAPVVLVQEGSLLSRMRGWGSSTPSGRRGGRTGARSAADYEQAERGGRRSGSAGRERRQRREATSGRRSGGASRERRIRREASSGRRSGGQSARRSRGEAAGPNISMAGGVYTTMCVRACDGYFFPISFSTVSDRFEADEAACQARCPGMEVSLYVHRTLYEPTEAMRSLDGKPYGELATAYLYKLKGPQNSATCGCRVAPPPPGAEEPTDLAAADAQTDGSDEAATGLSAGLPQLAVVPLPRWRPDPNAPPEPETRTAILGDGPSERRIRIIGPTFYPDR